MTPQELKNSILQLAIQGKLVERRPEEGTAQELYEQIQAEKQRLIKEGKIKKEKGTYGEFKDEEIMFEIPKTWKWVHFGELMINRDAERIPLSVSERNKLNKVYDYYGASGVIDKVDRYLFNKTLLLVGEDGANLLARSTPIAYLATGKYWVNNHAHVLDCVEGKLSLEYIMYFINAISLAKYVTGTAQPKMNQEKMNSIPVALPPLSEQKRIVAKIEELLPLVDRYEQAWTKLEDFNRRFPEDMKKSILQQAIQGKLVEQRPEEGTAQELYAQIQAEKRRLIKEGKLKKEKPLPEITEEEKPFEIPEGWMWVRLGTLTEAITSGSRDWAKYYSKTGDIFLRMGNLSKNSFDLRLDKIQRVTIPESTEGKRTSLQAGDLLFSITGDVGMLGLIPPDFGVAYINQHTAMLRFMEKERNRYIPYLLLTDYAQKFYNGNQHGIKNSFRLDSIAWLPVPLPPLAEQKRIVEKLEELLARCERLKKKRT